MAKQKPGKRHTLLLYKRAMGRLWQATFFLGLILAGLWWQITSGRIPVIETKNSAWILVGAVVTLVFTLFALLARNMAYVQPRSTHIRLVTPFLRLQISYRRVRSVHPASFSKLFPPEERGWAEDQFLEPFYPMTVVVVELNAYPLPRPLLRLFLSRQMLASQGPGFIFVVEDWMALSTEIDTLLETYRRSRQPKHAIPSPFRTRW